LIVAVFVGVLYDTQNWWAAIFTSTIYAFIAYWVSWQLVKDKKKK
jgi:membrane protein implicated in regulation of membrane protease activity